MKLVILLVVGTFMVLTLPMQLQGVPGYIREFGAEMEADDDYSDPDSDSVIDALLALEHGTMQEEEDYEDDTMSEKQWTDTSLLLEENANKQLAVEETITSEELIDELALAQLRGITIERCLPKFEGLINAGLGLLNLIPGYSGKFGIKVVCFDRSHGYRCSRVTVDVRQFGKKGVPVRTDLELCDYDGNGDYCANVYATSCKPKLAPLTIPIPIERGGSGKDVIISWTTDILRPKCNSLSVNAKRCPHTKLG